MKLIVLISTTLLPLICVAEIPSNGPLVYPNWPPKPSNLKPHQSYQSASVLSNGGGGSGGGIGIVSGSGGGGSGSGRHQFVFQLRNGPPQSPNRYSSVPSNLFFKRPPQSMQSMPPQRLIRPVKMASSPHYNFPMSLSSSKNYHTAQHQLFFKKPNLSTSSIGNMNHHGNGGGGGGSGIGLSPSSSTKLNFHSSVKGPHSGEYVFENPFTVAPNQQQSTQSTQFFKTTLPQQIHHRPLSNKYSPIHTIPAPNLSQNLHESKPFAGQINAPLDNNHIYDNKESINNIYNFQRPTSLHQYQVTEPSNDHTIRDPLTGKHTLYAPDPDPSLPVYQIRPAADPFSQPSSSNTDHRFTSVSASLQASPSAAALIHQPYIQLANPVPQQQQQQLPTDLYGLQLNHQPQLQQHFLQQQQSIYQAMPQNVYNPTYLVQQSNQLLNQHKQHLFKPDPDFIEQQFRHHQQQQQHPQRNNFEEDSEFLPSFNAEAAATAAAAAAATSALNSGNIYSSTQSANSGDQYTVQESQSVPQYARLIAANPFGDNLIDSANHDHQHLHQQQQQQQQQQQLQRQPSLTSHEVSNLLNFGRLEGGTEIQNNPDQGGFIASTYYQPESEQQQEQQHQQQQPPQQHHQKQQLQSDLFDIQQHQQQNQERINQANQALHDQQNNIKYSTPYEGSTIYVTQPPGEFSQRQTASQRHEQRLAEHFNGNANNNNNNNANLRIFVPDSEYPSSVENNDNFHKRSDEDLSSESSIGLISTIGVTLSPTSLNNSAEETAENMITQSSGRSSSSSSISSFELMDDERNSNNSKE